MINKFTRAWFKRMRGGKARDRQALDDIAIMETIDIMSDPDLLAEVRRGIEDLSAGRVVSIEDVEKEFAG